MARNGFSDRPQFSKVEISSIHRSMSEPRACIKARPATKGSAGNSPCLHQRTCAIRKKVFGASLACGGSTPIWR